MMQPNPITSPAAARKAGYEIMRGEYQGASDDRSGRWYVQRPASGRLDFRGPGYATRREALEAIAQLAQLS